MNKFGNFEIVVSVLSRYACLMIHSSYSIWFEMIFGDIQHYLVSWNGRITCSKRARRNLLGRQRQQFTPRKSDSTIPVRLPSCDMRVPCGSSDLSLFVVVSLVLRSKRDSINWRFRSRSVQSLWTSFSVLSLKKCKTN